MLAQSAVRARLAVAPVARRGFSTTRARFDSPYHYPEGPRSNLPFNTQTRFFAVRYWAFMGAFETIMLWPQREFTDSSAATGFGLPFAVAGKYVPSLNDKKN
jgi:cytochrome c oxidase subunit 7c